MFGPDTDRLTNIMLTYVIHFKSETLWIRVLADIWKQGVQIEVSDFCVSKVWYKIHTTNKIDPIPLQILLF